MTLNKTPLKIIDHSISLFKPFHGEEEIEAVAEVLRSGWWGQGPKTVEFEERFAAFVRSSKGVSLNSATAALHLALKVADVEGGEVISTPMTFVSTNHAILLNNATPVFADIDADTLNIDPVDIEHKITPKTRAILPVHYGGLPADLARIGELAKAHNLIVIEDAAHAVGSVYHGKPIGSISPMTCFSFHPVKNLATGDGGMITFGSEAYAEQWDTRLRSLRWVGITKDTWARSQGKDASQYAWEYDVEEIGYKYHSNDIMSAIALVQLARLPQTNERRREICAMYTEALRDLEWLQLPVEQEGILSARHNYVIRCDKRDELKQWLNEHRIGTGMHYIPNHLHAMYKPYATPLPVVEREWTRMITLPLHPAIPSSDIEYIIDVIGISLMPDLSIVIVNYNTREPLRRCLQSIQAQHGALTVQTIVVDNGSKDGSPAMVREVAPEAVLIEPGLNTWFTGGNNIGMKAATGDYVFILNPDTVMQPGTLQTLVAYLKAHPDVGAVTCRMEYPGGGLQATCSQTPRYPDLLLGYTFLGVLLAFWRDVRRKRMWYDGWQRDSNKSVEVIPDSSLMASRALLNQLNGYDEGMKLYFTEDDICRRILETGKQIHFVAETKLLHEEHASTSQVQRLASQVYFDDLLVYSHKYYGAVATLILQALIIPTRWAMDTVQRLRGQKKVV